jgi:hypothetical protein
MNKDRYAVANYVKERLMDQAATLRNLSYQELMSTNGKSKDSGLIEEALSLVIEACEKLEGIDY